MTRIPKLNGILIATTLIAVTDAMHITICNCGHAPHLQTPATAQQHRAEESQQPARCLRPRRQAGGEDRLPS